MDEVSFSKTSATIHDDMGSYHRRRKFVSIVYISVSQPLGRGPVLGPGINYTGPQEVLLEFVILVF